MLMVMVILSLILSNFFAFSLVLILVEALAFHSSNYFLRIRSYEPSVNLLLSTHGFTYLERTYIPILCGLFCAPLQLGDTKFTMNTIKLNFCFHLYIHRQQILSGWKHCSLWLLLFFLYLSLTFTSSPSVWQNLSHQGQAKQVPQLHFYLPCLLHCCGINPGHGACMNGITANHQTHIWCLQEHFSVLSSLCWVGIVIVFIFL